MAIYAKHPGNHNARKAKIWEQALKRALARWSNETVHAGLDAVADTVVKAAVAGDMSAIKEIGDRLDGKPAQQVEIDGELRTRDVSDKPLTADEWNRAYGDSLEAAAGTAEGTH